MNRSFKTFAFAAALSTLAFGAAHAQSGSFDSISLSQSVSYADLDLGSSAGMKTLTVRINSAAKTVCGPAPEYRDSRTAYDACIKTAVDHAMIQVARASEANRLALNGQRQHGG